MKYTEEATLFACAGDTLLGILARPEAPAETGVVVIVGGPQYRVGSHRQFVLLARALAAAGYPVLRFDYRGMGDSEGQQRDFQAVSADIAAAIDLLQEHMPSVKEVALWGLCDGASAALLYCHDTHDSRVTALCLLNPWVRSEASLAKTQVKHYYTQRLRQKEFWVKLFSGNVAVGAASGLLRSLKSAFTGPAPKKGGEEDGPFQTRMAQAWKNLNHPILLLLSANDYTAKEFIEYAKTSADWSGALAQALLQTCDLPEADHSCSSAAWRTLVEARMLEWLMRATPSPNA
ncbi:MAG: hydrolase 1, exosortase A system-associated [Rhodoferax sp.]|uniref:hydrolase 1, exosortase A system-associated n=1 Tax=Rhodoferax sp. TaxID=50421 RepID=UPI0027271925|nr:hydrolase 1, exosortase A system-associated [Rhodoferax sp.]MDO8450895.1 hydrolase 1, exosortase A system-associated [Rhodoferax sp.]